MSSVLSSYSQRDNNVTNVTPVTILSGGWSGYQRLDIDPRYCQVFNIDMSLADISTPDITNRLTAYGNIGTNSNVPTAYFVVIIDPKYAALYPGRELTLNFNRNGVNSDTCVDVYPTANVTTDGDINNNGCDLLSPQYGFDGRETQTLKIKSNGTNFVPISSGPVSWSSNFDC